MSTLLRGLQVLVLCSLWSGTREGTVTSVIPALAGSDDEPKANVIVILDPNDTELRRDHGSLMPLTGVEVHPPGTPEVAPAPVEGQPAAYLVIAKGVDTSSPQGVTQAIDAVRQQVQGINDSLASIRSEMSSLASRVGSGETATGQLTQRVNDLSSGIGQVSQDVQQLSELVAANAARAGLTGGISDVPLAPPADPATTGG